MNTKDLIVILLILSVFLWAVFHQLASKYINENEDLKKNIYQFDLYKNRSMDISNIELVISLVAIIHIINFFSKNSLENYFKKRHFLIFESVNFDVSCYIIESHKKLWGYIKISILFMFFIILFTIFFWIF